MNTSDISNSSGGIKQSSHWVPPDPGSYKINVDASVYPGIDSFSIGLVLRDHGGTFIAGKFLNLRAPDSVFKAEMIGIREALSWIAYRHMHEARIVIESDSQLAVRDIQNEEVMYLEVGEVIVSCCQKLRQFTYASVKFVRRNANRVAHILARYPCIAYFHSVFTSPHLCVVKALMYDVSH